LHRTVRTLPGIPVAEEIAAAIETVAAELERRGAKVETASVPDRDPSRDLSNAGELIGMAIGAFRPEPDKPPITLAQYLGALHRRDQAIIAWEQFFERWDALLCPPSMITAFPHCELGADLQIDGRPVAYWLINAHTTLFNYTGQPAVVLPFTVDRDGLPIGVQLVGKRWSESRLLATARAVTRITGDFRRPPGY
jgi:amidase